MHRLADPFVPDPDVSRQWVETELARPEYDTNLDPVSRFVRWILKALSDLMGEGNGDFPLELALIITFAVLLLVILVLVVTNPIRLRKARSHAVMGNEDFSLAEARERVTSAQAQGAWDEATVWAFRCEALLLDELRILKVTPGLTAQEVTRAAQPHFAETAEELAFASTMFDEVRYGEHFPTEEDFLRVAAIVEMLESRR